MRPARPAARAAASSRREAAYRAAGALENLSSDNLASASVIVNADVVPAMQELLIKGEPLSSKAARTSRVSLQQRDLARAASNAAEHAKLSLPAQVCMTWHSSTPVTSCISMYR